MIHNESRLNHMLFCKFFKEKVEDVALLVAFFKLNTLFLSNCLSLFIRMNFVEINTWILFNSVKHCNSLKRLAKIHFNAVVCDCCCAENLLCNMAIEVFGKIHHTVVVGICLIKLHKSKLWVMTGVNTLVTEYSADFVNLFKSAYDKSFEVKFKRNSEL